MSKRLTAIIQREDDGFVALCPELDIASQGDTIETARDNLREAVELFFEHASAAEIQQRMTDDTYVTQFEVVVGSSFHFRETGEIRAQLISGRCFQFVG